jgi:hypothetical protein
MWISVRHPTWTLDFDEEISVLMNEVPSGISGAPKTIESAKSQVYIIALVITVVFG